MDNKTKSQLSDVGFVLDIILGVWISIGNFLAKKKIIETEGWKPIRESSKKSLQRMLETP